MFSRDDADLRLIAKGLLKDVNQKSFNMISVDGDTSTNDCAFFLANGASGVAVKTDADFKAFKDALTSVAQELAKDEAEPLGLKGS